MKKALSILLCITLMISAFSTASSVGANTNSTQFENTDLSNTTSIDNLSWSSNIKEAITYLSVDQTGYYDMSVTDHAKTSTLEIYFTDSDLAGEGDLWYNTLTFPEFKDGVYSEENLYLVADHTYQIQLIYRDYDYENDNHLYHDAKVSIRFNKTDYTPTHLTLDSAQDITINNTSYSWFEFTTSAAGDYHLNSNLPTDVDLGVYNKETGDLVSYYSWYRTTAPRMPLEANTDYIVKVRHSDYGDKTLKISVSKASDNVSKVEISNPHEFVFTPDDGDIFEAQAFLHFEDMECLYFDVTYSSGKTISGYYYDLILEGIVIDEIEYIGDICQFNDSYFFETGEQPVSIEFNGTATTSYIFVTEYTDWNVISGADICEECDCCYHYENGFDL